MLKIFFLNGLLLVGLIATAQTNYKKTETFSLNLLTGYQSFPDQRDIDERFTANGYSKLNNPPFTLGIEFAVAAPRSVTMVQFRGTSLFTSKKVTEMTNQSASLSFQYGYDLLPRLPATYFYPFAGMRYFNWTLFGKSTAGNSFTAEKNNFDFLAGLGLKQFLNDDLRGVFNNAGLTVGVSLPLTNGRWKGRDDSDPGFITGTMKNSLTWFVTLSIGRGFRPARVR